MDNVFAEVDWHSQCGFIHTGKALPQYLFQLNCLIYVKHAFLKEACLSQQLIALRRTGLGP